MGGKQLGFSDYEQTTAEKRTKKEKFLALVDTPILAQSALVFQGLPSKLCNPSTLFS